MIDTPGKIVNVKLPDTFCTGGPESVTLIVNGVAVAVAEGVPLITPELDSVKPAGSVPDVNDQVKGPVPPVAANCVKG